MNAPRRALVLLVALILGAACSTDKGRTEPAPDVREPVRDSIVLGELPDPYVDSYEPAVRLALQSARRDTVEVVESADASAIERAQAYGELGRVYLAYDLVNEAESCFRNAWYLDLDDHHWPFYLGYLLVEGGEYERSLEPLERALSNDPEDLSSAILLARANLALEHLEEAAKVLAGAPASDTDPHHLLELGNLARARGQYAQAVEYLERVVALRPNAGDAYYQLGLNYRDLGREEEARAALAKRGVGKFRLEDSRLDEVSQRAAGYRVLNRLGNEAFLAGRFEESIKLFRAALEVDPAQSRVRVNLAAALSHTGRVEEAETELRRTVTLDGNSGIAAFNLGALLAKQGQIEEARLHYERAAELDPTNADIYFNLANLLRRSGDYSEASESYRQVIAIDPTSGRARYGLALSSMLQGEWTQGIEGLREAIELLPDEHPLQGLLVTALAAAPVPSIRRPEEALTLARSLFEAEPSVENAQTLVLALTAQGDYEAADQLLGDTIDTLERLGHESALPPLRSARQSLREFKMPEVLVPWDLAER